MLRGEKAQIFAGKVTGYLFGPISSRVVDGRTQILGFEEVVRG